MKNDMTVWSFPYRKRYYLTHPLKMFGQIKRNIRAAYDRITKGYCVWDWSDFDSWFITIIPCMLRDMALKGCAYPGVEPFETPEKWHEWLNRMASQLEACQNEDDNNEYYEPYMAMLDNGLKDNKIKDIREKYAARNFEILKEHNELFKKTMAEMFEHWDCLWD